MRSYELIWQTNLLAVVLVTLLVLASAALFYRRILSYMSAGRVAVLVLLRVLAIVVLLMLLFKPALSFSVMPRDRSRLALAVDCSRSMSVEDEEGESRLARVQRLLAENYDLLTQKPQAVVVTFADSSRQTDLEQLSEAAVRGRGSNLASPLAKLSEYLPGDELQALMVFTDGNHLAAGDVVEAASRLDRPIYYFAVGSDRTMPAKPNFSLRLIDPPIKINVSADNVLSAELQWEGKLPEPVKLETKLGKRLVKAEPVSCEGISGKKQVHVTLRPSETGKAVVAVEGTFPAGQSELIGEDNLQERHFLVVREKVKILIIEGQLRPEYRFLKQFLADEPQVEYTSFVQIRPGKFLISASTRGDQPKQLGRSKSDFEKYDLFVLGNISSRTLNDGQAEVIRDLVEAGKGLLVIAGTDTCELRKTALSDILPINLAESARWSKEAFLPHVTAAGQVHPVLADLREIFDPSGPYKLSARVEGHFYLGEATPASVVLLEKARAGGPAPILALRNVGKGRTAISACEGTWRWRLNPQPIVTEKLYRGFWGQLVRNLTGKEPAGEQEPQLVANLSSSWTEAGRPVRLTVHVFDNGGKATVEAKTELGVSRQGQPEPAPKLAGGKDHYFTDLKFDKPGEYLVEARAKWLNHELADSLKLRVYQIDQELSKVAVNRELLDQLSRAGRTDHPYQPEEFGGILRQLREEYFRRASKEVEYHQVRSFDYRGYQLIVFLALVTGEWLVRRRWRLR